MTTQPPDVFRTPDERFAALQDWPFEPHYLDVSGLRMHYVDEGPADAPVFLLLHGEPSWSYLYRHWIPEVVAAGYRAVAVDAVGFGRSDKVTDPSWYCLDRHIGQLTGFIEGLDLRRITVAVQDWAGPVGLCTAVDVEARVDRLLVMNTWLHHDDYEYTTDLREWHTLAATPGFPMGRVVGAVSGVCSPDDTAVLDHAYTAPFPTAESMAGAVAWPAMLPFAAPGRGGADRQAATLEALRSWDRPAHFLFGDGDPVFTPTWGERFAAMVPGATFGTVPGATHFVQEVGAPLAQRFLDLINNEQDRQGQ